MSAVIKEGRGYGGLSEEEETFSFSLVQLYRRGVKGLYASTFIPNLS